ncbi:hypothetical protein AB1A81_17430 [Bdellovibrio bacteriovorus]|uniref:Uncharacterized protein n=1 Tax=Bdellovibrio bacteriovorus (strain ATCC 15356 / DSM 50701 / NCIMB 9529 / HD100) TaxID=264462 RepID=Q6MGX2_BDEBA|nr:hypothetical protein [Bdellovibrio bacteriovorus]AHZ85552.1 hypothetical protein EP01_11490 [Bdellovibrio bacteriovorus]BEV70099.1 hypothetical protein Bb109J_c3519 [Bdellovibrio bacteriovorus]CAE81157.1 hypothetical protein predicted by Glimmer/Critica [Bdellovibrio bacteriovorus HD100]
MAQADKKQVALEKLVDELMKDQPSRQLVKQLTNELGMPYSLDPMTQINTVLQSMNTVYLRSNRRKDLEG